jgi:hypothetical protein
MAGAEPSTQASDLPPPADRRRARVAGVEWLLVMAGASIHALWKSPEIAHDGMVRYQTLLSLVNDGKISEERYSILQSLLAVPFYYIGNAFGAGERAVAHFNIVVFLASMAGFYALLSKRVSPVVLRRTLLLLFAASMFGRHIQTFYGETLTACAALLGIAALVAERPLLAASFMCVSVVNTPVAVAGLLATNGLWALRTRRWLQAAAPVVLSVALVILEFWWRRGSPFQSGYQGDVGARSVLPTAGQPGFNFPLAFGLLGLTLSFGKGLLFFAPGLILHLAGYPTRETSLRALARYSLAFVVGLLFAYAKWWSWYGGWFWGPRFMLFAAVPASLAIAAHLTFRDPRLSLRAALLPILAFSAWVGINGMVWDQNGMGLCRQRHYQLEALCWYTPEFSALFRPFYVEKALAPADYLVIAYSVLVVIVLGAGRLMPLVKDSFAYVRDFVRAQASTAEAFDRGPR